MQVIVNDTLIDYSDRGTGKVIVCVHGWMHDQTSFEALTSKLAGCHIIALDLPNFGKSQKTEIIQSIDDYAKFVAAFVDKLGISDYVLLGHSMGGQIAIHAVGQGILKPTRLILIGAAGIRDEAKMRKTFLRATAKVLRRFVPKTVKSKAYNVLGSDYNPDLSDIHKQIIAKTLSTDVQADAKAITIPSLLVYGSDDTSTPMRYGKKFADAIAGSRLEVIPGAKHWPHQSEPAQVARLIKAFLV